MDETVNWTRAHFYKMPGNLTGEELVEVELDDGSRPVPRQARLWYWHHCNIISYRVANVPSPPDLDRKD